MKTLIAGALVVASIALVAGCNTGRGHLSEHHGEALSATLDAQVENPGAGGDAPVEGIDPRTAEHVMENYSTHQQGQAHGSGRDRRSNSVFIGEIN